MQALEASMCNVDTLRIITGISSTSSSIVILTMMLLLKKRC